MLHFKSRAEAAKARVPGEHKRVVLARIDDFLAALALIHCEWNAAEDGHFAYATTEQADAPLVDFGWDKRLRDLTPEAVRFHADARLWEIVHISGNSWGWTCFVADSPALPREVREWLLANAGEADAALARRTRA